MLRRKAKRRRRTSDLLRSADAEPQTRTERRTFPAEESETIGGGTTANDVVLSKRNEARGLANEKLRLGQNARGSRENNVTRRGNVTSSASVTFNVNVTSNVNENEGTEADLGRGGNVHGCENERNNFARNAANAKNSKGNLSVSEGEASPLL